MNSVGQLYNRSESDASTCLMIPSYKNAASPLTIEPCIESVLATLRPEDELIIVDNASLDGTASFVIESAQHQARLIQNRTNLGFSAGCNIGIQASRGKTVVLLNPDCTVKPGWLDSFETRLSDPAVGAVGPVSDHVSAAQFVGFYLPNNEPRLTTDQLHCRVRQLHRGQVVETKLLIGFCIAFRRDVLAEAGLLDEDLFLGGEDLEMSLRLRANNYCLVIAPDVFVHHSGGASFKTVKESQTRALLEQSTLALHRKIQNLFAPRPEPSSMELFGTPILPPAIREEIHVA
jgi:GT2 family glycosyltransferase